MVDLRVGFEQKAVSIGNNHRIIHPITLDGSENCINLAQHRPYMVRRDLRHKSLKNSMAGEPSLPSGQKTPDA